MSAEPRPLGVLFDWDGVVIDSHDQHRLAWHRMAAELGLPFTDDLFAASFGMRNQNIIGPLFGWADPADTARIQEIGDRKEHLYREIIRESGIEPLPGVHALLEELAAAAIPCAVGSSTPRENIRVILESTGLGRFFHAVVTAEDVSRGKPAPDVFLLAAERIHRPAVQCVVLEDAHVGIQAARAAGAKVIGVATTHPADTLAADVVVPDLSGVSLALIRSLWP